MKIGLIDVDSHNFPNLALMKIAFYHRSKGDHVEWFNHLMKYDRVYKSKVFTFTPDINTYVQTNEIIEGGTGYLKYDELFCDDSDLDYSLYPMYENAYGFLTRGCIRSCPWCIVPQKEGLIRPYRDIESVLQNKKKAVLMDNNILASDFGIRQIEKIIDLGCQVDFNQGLDARLVTDDIAKLLSKIRWIRYIRFSCDTISAIEPLLKAVSLLNKYGVKNYRIFVYVLVNDIQEANERCEIMKELGVIPFAQPLRLYKRF